MTIDYEYQYPACREDKRLPPPVHHGLPFLCFGVARGSPGRSMGSKSRISRFMRLLFGKHMLIYFNGFSMVFPHVFPDGSPSLLTTASPCGSQRCLTACAKLMWAAAQASRGGSWDILLKIWGFQCFHPQRKVNKLNLKETGTEVTL